jgi:hypothetical protein
LLGAPAASRAETEEAPPAAEKIAKMNFFIKIFLPGEMKLRRI